MSQRGRFCVGAIILIGLGVIAGIIGERSLWFGLAKQHLRVEDCRALIIAAPYDAWHFRMERDGSAFLVSGAGRNSFDVGFDPIVTAMNLSGLAVQPVSEVQRRFPAGSFDFPSVCRELMQGKQTKVGGHNLDYPDMSWRLQFVPTEDWLNPAKRDQFHLEDTSGFLAPGAGQKLIESVRAKALELNTWDKVSEDLWPYPPVPWDVNPNSESGPVPGKLRLEALVKLGQSWEGFLRDENLLTAAPGSIPPLGATGFITDEAAWAELWSAWRGDESLPKVDFEKELVLVFALRGWSKLARPKMPLDNKGELFAGHAIPRESQGGDGFGYLLGTVPREGIKSVNGVLVERK